MSELMFGLREKTRFVGLTSPLDVRRKWVFSVLNTDAEIDEDQYLRLWLGIDSQGRNIHALGFNFLVDKRPLYLCKWWTKSNGFKIFLQGQALSNEKCV
jgi:hypothetical protein